MTDFHPNSTESAVQSTR